MDTHSILTIHNTVITRNYRISLVQADGRNWVLRISNVQESDRGWYMCQVSRVRRVRLVFSSLFFFIKTKLLHFLFQPTTIRKELDKNISSQNSSRNSRFSMLLSLVYDCRSNKFHQGMNSRQLPRKMQAIQRFYRLLTLPGDDQISNNISPQHRSELFSKINFGYDRFLLLGWSFIDC